MVIPQLLLLSAMSGLGSFLLVPSRSIPVGQASSRIGAQEETPGLTRAMGVLFPALGLLVIIGLL